MRVCVFVCVCDVKAAMCIHLSFVCVLCLLRTYKKLCFINPHASSHARARGLACVRECVLLFGTLLVTLHTHTAGLYPSVGGAAGQGDGSGGDGHRNQGGPLP